MGKVPALAAAWLVAGLLNAGRVKWSWNVLIDMRVCIVSIQHLQSLPYGIPDTCEW